MAHTKIAKTTLALAAGIMATALTPGLAAARDSSGGSAAHPGSRSRTAHLARRGHIARAAARGGAASVGATAAPRLQEAEPQRRGSARHHHRRRHGARAQRFSHRHGHHHHHRRHHHHKHHVAHRQDISYEGSTLATWFGPGLYGRHTACGQVLTRQLAGVANRTLPCGTLVAVTYEGRHLTVPVVDRGPYSSIGASWDLTEMAAELLGITETVQIETKIVGHVKNSPTLGLLTGAGLPERSPLEEEEAQQQSATTGGAVAS